MSKAIIFISAIILAFLSPCTCSLYGQEKEPVEVQISKNKVIIDGTVYYIHIVKKGQTLYSISKTYKVPEESIINENPGADISLQEGQALKIPVAFKYTEVQLTDHENYIYHIIKPGQTLYFLTKEYNISLEEIERHNPEVKYDSLQINQVIKIPRKRHDEPVLPEQKYIEYKVKRRETLYSISRRHKVTEEEIRKANPELKISILKEGQIIKIPLPVDPNLHTKQHPQDTTPVPHYSQIDTLPVYDSLYYYCDSFDYTSNPLTYDIVFLLPFCIQQRKELMKNPGIEEAGEYDFIQAKQLRNMLYMSYCLSEFYEGSLLAAKALKEEGVSMNIKVYDTEKDTLKIKQILSQGILDSVDLIIGPIYKTVMQYLFKKLPPNGSHLISPLCYKLSGVSNNDVFVVNPPKCNTYGNLMKVISNFAHDNIVVIYAGDSQSEYELSCFDREFKQYMPDSAEYNLILFNDTTKTSIYSVIKGKVKNHVVILTEEEIYLSKVVAKLNLRSMRFDIRLYGFSSWTNLISIDDEFYHKLEFIYATPFYIDYEQYPIINYQYLYKKYFKTYPHLATLEGYNYSLLGYDIVYYFGSALKKYGKSFQYCLDEDFQVLQYTSSFNFMKDTIYGYYQNHGVSYVQYTKDFIVKKLDDIQINDSTTIFLDSLRIQ